MSKIIKIISTVFMTLGLVAIVLFVFISLSPLKILKIHFVASGSMEPAIKTGSVILVAKTDSSQIKPNDIINFYPNLNSDETVTHRVTDIINADGSLMFTTKGDANQTADIDPVEADRLFGKLVFNIPFLGYFYAWTKTLPGFIISIILPSVYIIISEIIKIKKTIEQEAIKKYQHSQKPKSGDSIFPTLFLIFSLFSFSCTTSTHSYFSSGLVIDGNVFATGSWQTDTTPPTTQITTDSYAQTSTPFDIAFTINDDNPAYVELCHTFGLASWSCHDIGLISPFSFTPGEGDGVYCFDTIGHDTVGNVETNVLPSPATLDPLDPNIYCTNHHI